MKLNWIIEYLDVDGIIPVKSKNFPSDQLIVYQGFYGVPSYVIWYARPYPEKPRQFKVSDIFNLTLATFGTRAPFIEDFRVQSVIFDVTKKMWRVFAVSSTWLVLSTTNNIQQFEYAEETCGIEIIKDVIGTIEWDLGTNYDADELEEFSLIKYKYITFDKETTILDVISKICKENNWEWFLSHDQLHVSRSLWLDPNIGRGRGKQVVPTAVEEEHIKDAIGWEFRVRTLQATGAEPMTIFDTNRVLWVKYILGEGIGYLMTIMCHNNIYPLIVDYPFPLLKEDDFYKTLQGVAKDFALQRTNRVYREMPIIAGKIFGKVEDPDVYQTPKFSGDVLNPTKDWDTRKYYNENDYADEKKIPRVYTAKSRITTPYAGDGVGMLFPQEENQHRLLFSPNGERDMGLIGPGFYAEGQTPPVRGSEKDFRLQMPNGSGSMYFDNDKGRWFLQGKKIAIGNTPPAHDENPDHDIYKAYADEEQAIEDSAVILIGENGGIKIKNKQSDFTIFPGGCIHFTNQIGGKYSVQFDADLGSIRFLCEDDVIFFGDVKVYGNLEVGGNLSVPNGKVAGQTVMSTAGILATKIPPIPGPPVLSMNPATPTEPPPPEDEGDD